MSLEIEIFHGQEYQGSIFLHPHPQGIRISRVAFDPVILRPRDAFRLAALLDCWAEKGYLPEGKVVWE